jgi:hypothetical protein
MAVLLLSCCVARHVLVLEIKATRAYNPAHSGFALYL